MSAPVCELTTPQPNGDPHRFKGLQQIPPGATLPQAITIINNNLVRIASTTINNNITNNNRITGPGAGGNWVEVRNQRVTQRVRVHSSQDPDEYVDILQINHLVMVDRNTGATWIWNR